MVGNEVNIADLVKIKEGDYQGVEGQVIGMKHWYGSYRNSEKILCMIKTDEKMIPAFKYEVDILKESPYTSPQLGDKVKVTNESHELYNQEATISFVGLEGFRATYFLSESVFNQHDLVYKNRKWQQLSLIKNDKKIIVAGSTDLEVMQQHSP